MPDRAKGSKGYDLEEILRAYFLRAGFYVVRSVPLQQAGDDLTDIDLWLYERPTGSSRRRQIVDAKSKNKPKAIERFLWTRGLLELLQVEGGYVATTDTRPMLRTVAKKLSVSLLDGADLTRIAGSEKVTFDQRITEENLLALIATFDRARRNKTLQNIYTDIKGSLVDQFGGHTLNRALDALKFLTSELVLLHPNSPDAQTATRIVYFVSSVVAISADFVLSELSFRSSDERYAALVNAIRFGDTDAATGRERVMLAVGLLRKYGPKGEASGHAVEAAVMKDLQSIPAEIIADHVVRHTKQDDLFQTARRLEQRVFAKEVTPFDALPYDDKSLVAAILDFVGVDRARFAVALTAKESTNETESSAAGPLFSATGRG